MSRIVYPAVAVARHADDSSAHRLAGVLIVTLFPALFWMAAIAGMSSLLGYAASPTVLIACGSAIAAFCGGVAALLAHTQP